ncbi:SirB1 family protein [Paludisphaera soli]|uniref:SirB1 family protein n=1 Tax=Paludisphaera soli TaxID=2712865 RepID=UPI0013EA0ECC|nr:transglutaminase-like domain-containing protein [Paludisphaera soli]
MRASYPTSPEFERVVRGEAGADLARVALEIARDFRPGLDVEAQLGRIDALADRVRVRIREGAPARKLIGQINWVLFVEEGYKGNVEDYFEARNSYLDDVLDRRTGIPITLSILYRAIAGRLGLELSPANLPAHFMLRLDDGEPAFLDAFHGGELLDRAGCQRRIAKLTGLLTPLSDAQLAPCSDAAVAARLLRNLKAIHLGEDDFPSALLVQRRLAAVSDDATELRDLGMLCLRLDEPGQAIDPLTAYLKARPKPEDAEEVGALLSGARSAVARWN